MNDLVQRLRKNALNEAADELERLRSEIKYLKQLIAEALDEIQRMKLEAVSR